MLFYHLVKWYLFAQIGQLISKAMLSQNQEKICSVFQMFVIGNELFVSSTVCLTVNVLSRRFV